MTRRIEYVALHEVIKWPRNPKDHDIGAISQSIDRFGFVNSLIVDEKTGRLVAGHGRLDSLLRKFERGEPPPKYIELRSDEEWLVPVERGVEFSNEKEAKAYIVADNQTTVLGGFNDEYLAETLKELYADPDWKLAGTGFDEEDLDDLEQRLNPNQQREQQTSSAKSVTCPHCGCSFDV